jgi:hypothetical protein
MPLRVAAASLVARAEGSRDATESLAQRCLGVDVPESLARLTLMGAQSPRARFLAGLRGLAFWPQLRDAFDEDWFRNPRSAEVLRAGLALLASGPPGAAMQLPGVLETPLGDDDIKAARARVQEMLG